MISLHIGKSRVAGIARLWGSAAAVTLALGLTALGPAWAANFPSTNVAWVPAASDADVDAAFARARAEKKPVLLYWGATWCPPCNQLKATFFNRQDFANQARSVVAVHVDGDRPGAQKLGSRFKVRGYPTVVLMNAEGAEISRLPGEADPAQIMALLQAALSGGRPLKAVLTDARAGKTLSANEWRMLAFHSWDLDEGQAVASAQRPAVMLELAQRASTSADAETATRLWLKTLVASAGSKDFKPEPAARERMVRTAQAVMGDTAASRLHMDVLTNYASSLVQALAPTGGAEQAQWIARLDAALVRLQNDASLSRGDRQGALISRVNLVRLPQGRDVVQPQLAEPLVREVREMASRMDREITDGYERQAVITASGYLLAQAGLWADSEALLRGNLARSHSPYYLMSQLASNARKQGKKDEALSWYQQSFDRSEGPATRLQWGAGYLAALVDLAPTDAARIEKTAAQLIAEAAKDKGAFHERSARSMQRISAKLMEWNKDGTRSAAVQRLRRQVEGVCPSIEATDGQRAACEALLKPAA